MRRAAEAVSDMMCQATSPDTVPAILVQVLAGYNLANVSVVPTSTIAAASVGVHDECVLATTSP